MGLPERTVTALARAYAMSEILSLEEPTVHREVEAVTTCHRDVGFRVVARGITVDGDLLEDPDGSVAELSRDLGLAGVAEVRLSAEPTEESVDALIRSLRGGSDRLRAIVEALSGISISFRETDAPGPHQPGTGSGASGGMSSGSLESIVTRENEGHGRDSTDPGGGAGEPGTEPATELDTGQPLEPPDLLPLADAYLEADGARRETLGEEIRERAREASEMDADAAVAEAVERLILQAGEGRGRAGALELARDLFDADVAAAIVRRLGALRSDEERDRRIRVVTTLRGPMAPAFSDGLAETDDRGARHAYLDALVALGEDGRAEARKMLEDSRWWVIRNGATILGGTGTQDDVEDLTTHLAHEDARVRLQTVRALAHIGGDDAGMLLLGMVDDPDPDVRAAVATALGALGPDRAVKSLLERLETEEVEKVEVQIIRALGALGDPGAVPSIEKRAVGTFFSRSPAPVRVAAYRALASIGTPRASQLLEEARDDRDDEVRRVVRAILERREA